MENKNNENSEVTFKITGDWAAQSKRLKAEFAQLNDQDLRYEAGKENELLKRVETKLNKKREEVIGIFKKTESAPASK
jgi:hypothetical protein